MSNHATIKLTNKTSHRILAQLYHQNPTNGVQSAGVIIEANQTATMLTANFKTGLQYAGVPDWWFLVVHSPGAGATYASGDSKSSSIASPDWKECQLQSADANQTLTFTVDSSTFKINLKSGGTSTSMRKIRDFKPIQNVFVLMLENHSFDNMFAYSGISGTTRATSDNTNVYAGKTYHVHKPAPASMVSDPGHEFNDVLMQLTSSTTYTTGHYPPINNSGFASSYATSKTEGPTPPAANITDIMACFDTPSQLPVIERLAKDFVICDHWYSSLPGPTWPNRFFVHCASSGGMDDSPSTAQMTEWETVNGFRAPNGSIFDKLDKTKWSSGGNLQYRLYQDSHWDVSMIAAALGASYGVGGLGGVVGATSKIPATSIYSDHPKASGGVEGMGWVPQVLALNGIQATQLHSMGDYEGDLAKPYDAAYTFIEPHYGNATNGSFAGGSSQHPMDDTYGGEALIKAVYEGLRNSPLWYTSVLIVVYDEHGGFYDSVSPPTATAPGDGGKIDNEHGFDFKRYGVRVPAVVISPLVKTGVSNAVYDHSSVPRTLEKCFGMGNLTSRDNGANHIDSLCTLSISSNTIRKDCVTQLPSPVASPSVGPAVAPDVAPAVAMREGWEDEPLPEQGNTIGFLQILLKTQFELSDGSDAARTACIDSVRELRTRGDAAKYAAKVWQALLERRAAAQAAEAADPLAGPVEVPTTDPTD